MRQLVAHAVCLLLLAAPLSLAPLAAAQDEAEIAKLTAALASKKTADRAKAADELSRAGEKAKAALPALIKALEDDEKDVRFRAARAIGGLGSLAQTALG